MERYLRPLAIAVVIIEMCAAVFTVPVLIVYLILFNEFRGLAANILTTQALTITGTTLTFVMGILAAISAAQRGTRHWSIAFVLLLALFAYSPLLLTGVAQSETYIADAASFNLNIPVYTFVELCNHILPAIILAVVVFIYSLRNRHVSSQGHDVALEIERSQIK